MANIERIQKWHDALLSGDYKQARRALRDDDGFCCLGVACDVSKQGEWRATLNTYIYDVKNGKDEINYMPVEVTGWYGIESSPAIIQSDLITLNDEDEATFAEIAAKIREFWPEVKLNG